MEAFITFLTKESPPLTYLSTTVTVPPPTAFGCHFTVIVFIPTAAKPGVSSTKSETTTTTVPTTGIDSLVVAIYCRFILGSYPSSIRFGPKFTTCVVFGYGWVLSAATCCTSSGSTFNDGGSKLCSARSKLAVAVSPTDSDVFSGVFTSDGMWIQPIHTLQLALPIASPHSMAGGNTPKPSHAAFSPHRKSRWESSSSAATAAADHKSSAAQKSKPSPKPTSTPPNNKNANNKPQSSNPKPRPENPSPRPVNPNSIPGPRPIYPFTDPPPPPSYGFHMLDRRSIVLADGSVRSYFSLPPDYDNFTRMPRPGLPGPRDFGRVPMSPEFMGADFRARNMENWNAGPENSMKRKFGEDEREGRGGGGGDGFERQRQQLLQYGNANGPGPSGGYSLGRGEEMRALKSMRIVEGNVGKLKHSEVDPSALKKAFLHFVKLVFETANQRKIYLADGKQGPVPCLVCRRSSKDFTDTHSLIVHAYNSDGADSIVDHLAFHKALCILMGWNYLMPPDNSKAYQNFSANDAEANQDDLIMWPPSVLIHNTITGKGRDGRMEGIGNRAMDSILRDLGFTSGKSMSLYSKEGHMGIHMVKFSGDDSGLKEAMRLSDYFEREKHGRKGWARVQPSTLGKDDDNNPNLVKLDPKTGEKKRVFYGHLATAADLDKVTFEIKKKVSIVSLREYKQSK
ncbi:hypothetical protein BUALT_Bualt14G0093100 [Buddleja alternifolia]|uniref:XS domain-containing protein n=1 Tax=Buddleja alternifolia TaxID=168488 RepID=A0AAV6WPR0_9LAMI|nr:hypothetical protein BUALT_Bualt14G0093100 [Buddleja alternifolia]